MTISKPQGGPDRETPSLIPEAQVAQRWGKSVRTLMRMRQSAAGPAYVKIGRSVFYLSADVTAFETASRKTGGKGQ